MLANSWVHSTGWAPNPTSLFPPRSWKLTLGSNWGAAFHACVPTSRRSQATALLTEGGNLPSQLHCRELQSCRVRPTCPLTALEARHTPRSTNASTHATSWASISILHKICWNIFQQQCLFIPVLFIKVNGTLNIKLELALFLTWPFVPIVLGKCHEDHW